MGTLLVVVDPPCFDRGTGVVERRELMHVQALIPQAGVKRLDVPVVRRFAWPREVECYPAGIGPGVERLRRELGAVIDGDRR